MTAEHGTRARYSYGGCRCDACTWANTVYNREHRAGFPSRPPSHDDAVDLILEVLDP